MTVIDTNNDGTSAGAISDYTLSGDLTDGGEVAVTVSFSGKETTFQVNVTAVALESITAEFKQGENKIYTVDSLDKLKTWITVNGTNNDGTMYQGTIDYVLSGALSAGSGNIITVTVKDTEISTTFNNVEVTAAKIESIAVTAQPTKTAYTAKEDFDAARMVVTATFNWHESCYGLRCRKPQRVAIRHDFAYRKIHIRRCNQDTTVSDSVAKIQLAKPTVSGKYSYTGSEQEVALNGFDENTISIVSGNKFTNAGGAYAVVIGFKDAANYEWNDGSAENLSLSWAIAKKTVTAPVADATQFVYNGQEQTYAVANSDFYTVQGNKQTAANNWTVTVSLKDKSNTEWSDGGVDDVTFAFVIGKASFDMSGVTFDNITVKEDGNVHKLEISGLPQGVTVAYNGTNGYTADGVPRLASMLLWRRSQ